MRIICILTNIYCAGVTVLLSLTVFMNIVSELMPITSDAVPLIGKQTPPGKHYTSHIMPPPPPIYIIRRIIIVSHPAH